MRESSYHAILTEMTVRALWETQNVIDCIPDEIWDKPYGGAPLWQYLYHTLHGLDQWFLNPRDQDFVEPPIHTPRLQDLAIYPATRLTRRQINEYFHTIKAKLSLYLTALHDEDLLQRPEGCEWTRMTLILAQYRHLHLHVGMLMGFVLAETGLCPRGPWPAHCCWRPAPAAPRPNLPGRRHCRPAAPSWRWPPGRWRQGRPPAWTRPTPPTP